MDNGIDLQRDAPRFVATVTEAYYLHREITEKASDAILAFADFQRSHPSLKIGQERGLYAPELSRGEAARLWVGGNVGLDTSFKFCTAPELSKSVKTAVHAFREAAIHPLDLIGGSPTLTLVETGTTSGASVKARLARFWDQPSMTTAAAGPLADQLGLTLTDFEQARAYLTEEFRAFARSVSARKEVDPGNSFTRWAATATEPVTLPSAYYAAIGGVNNTNEFSETFLQTLPGDGYAEFVDALATLISQIVTQGAFPATPATIKQNVVDPLALLLSEVGRERSARFAYCDAGAGITAFRVEGFSSTDGMWALIGEDSMRCATTGTVEGGACTLEKSNFTTPWSIDKYWAMPFNFASTPSVGFNRAAGMAPGHAGLLPRNTRLYLAESVSGVPGTFKVLAGMTHAVASPGCTVTPVVPDAEQRAAKILTPSSKWCTHPTVECDGTEFDERLPLENELSDDSNGVESSWKQYLTLARSAANEADALAEAYIDIGVQKEQRQEQTELQEKANEIQMMDALGQLQDICGTSVDPVVLMDVFKDLAVMHGTGTFTACTRDADCTTAGSGMKCYGARCIKDPLEVAKSLPEDQLTRLTNCLGESGTIDFVTVGDVPVCLWHAQNNKNLVCAGTGPSFPGAQNPCPTYPQNIAAVGQQPVYTCTNMATPLATDAKILVDQKLEYFHPSEHLPAQPRTKDVCDSIRFFRKLAETNAIKPLDQETGLVQWAHAIHLDRIRKSEFFHPAGIGNVARRIGWTYGMDSYSAITVDGGAKWTTGDAWRGPETATWPCNNAQRPPACTGDVVRGLFCHGTLAGCGNVNERVVLNETMYRAVVAARMLALNGRSEGVAPTPARINNCCGRAVTTVGTRNRIGSSVPVTVLDFGSGLKGYTVQSTNPADRIFWSNSNFTFADITQLMPDGDSALLGVLPLQPAFRTWFTDEPGGGGSIVFVERPPSGSPPFEASRSPMLDGLSSAPFIGRTTGYFYEVFAGTRSFKDVGVDRNKPASFMYPILKVTRSGHQPPGFFEGEKTVKPFDYEAADLWNGLELLCEVGITATGCSPTNPPVVRTVEDLTLAKDYLHCVGNSISQHAGKSILAKFPKDAFDALKKQSVIGSFPANGGEYGVQIANLRSALVALSNIEPQISSEIRLLGDDLNAVRISLLRAGVQQQMQDIQFISTVSDRMAQCADGLIAGAVTFGLGAIAPCANALAQINFASQLNELAKRDSEFEKELKINDFNSIFATRAQNIDRYARNFAEQSSLIDGSLAQIERLRGTARRALSKAIFMRTNVASNAMAIDTTYRNRFNTARLRYENALANAKRLSFVAKRAIEQRLGVRLAEMQEDLPLVEAPARWEAQVCTARGIDFKRDVAGISDAGAGATLSDPNANFADLYIGDYVDRLENLVESYRLTYAFHEGTDTAVVSLRDDVQRVRAECDVPVVNLLRNSSALDRVSVPDSPGWDRLGCGTTVVNGVTVPLPNCVEGVPTQGNVIQRNEHEAGVPNTFDVVFGTGTGDCPVATCGFRPVDTALAQPFDLVTGKYVLSWYADPIVAQATGAPGFVSVRGRNRALIANTQVPAAANEPSGLRRYYMIVDVATDQPGTIEIRAPGTARKIKMAGFQLERVDRADVLNPTPNRYVDTQASNTRSMKVCEDTTGSEFRASRWTRGCVNLCPDGFNGECDASQAKSYCYRETTFSINQRDIEDGKIFVSSGFARGNFNYRIEGIGINFVGSNTRDCSDSTTPQSCFGAGFIPYSLYHTGPFYVRNHMGVDMRAMLFDGRIEHARGLASERYLTNPFGSADSGLIGQYVRREFQGRPLDGSFALRIWDEPGVKFDGIKDIQVVLNYRYWTRLN